MRVLDTLTTIVILGNLSSTISQEQIPSGDELIPIVTARNNIRNSSENMKRLTEENCESNFGPGKHKMLKEGWEYFENCQEPLRSTQFEADRIAASSNGKWDTFVKKYCGKVPSFMQCTSRMIDSVKPCLNLEDQGIIENNHNITHSFLEFICQNDGKRLASFYATGGAQCIDAKRRAFDLCPMKISGNHTVFLGDGRPVWVEMGLSECTNIERFGNCSVSVLRTCNDPTPANVLEYIFDYFKSSRSCPSMPSAEASPAT